LDHNIWAEGADPILMDPTRRMMKNKRTKKRRLVAVIMPPRTKLR